MWEFYQMNGGIVNGRIIGCRGRGIGIRGIGIRGIGIGGCGNITITLTIIANATAMVSAGS